MDDGYFILCSLRTRQHRSYGQLGYCPLTRLCKLDNFIQRWVTRDFCVWITCDFSRTLGTCAFLAGECAPHPSKCSSCATSTAL